MPVQNMGKIKSPSSPTEHQALKIFRKVFRGRKYTEKATLYSLLQKIPKFLQNRLRSPK